jgi:glycosyltransferase involved in cell wall biosynthesis
MIVYQPSQIQRVHETDEEWIESLIQLADDRELAAEMGDRGRKLVADRYSLQARKSQWIRILREIVAGRSSNSF